MTKEKRLFGNLLNKYNGVDFSDLNNDCFENVIDDSDIQESYIVKQESKKTLHFIWIGIPNDNIYLYLKVWSLHYPTYDINLWIDSKFLYVNHYKSMVREQFKDIKLINRLKIQDDLYDMYKKNSSEEDSLDRIIESKFDKRFNCNNSKNIIIQDVKSRFDFLNVLDIRKIDPILTKELESYYDKEMVLRTNVAAASDILRLCILSKYGGVYLDVDTLPCIDYIFKKSNCYTDGNVINNEFVQIYKSQLYLEKFAERLDGIKVEKISNIYEIKELFSNDEEFNNYIELIHLDIKNHDTNDVESIPFVLYKRLLMIGSSKTKLNTFYNNVLVCDKNSTVVSIIIKEIIKRYRYIEKNGYDKWESVNQYNKIYNNGSMERLIGYRLDGFADIPNTTVILTGPCMILEVYLSITYKVLRINSNVDPRKVASVYQAKYYGISCCNILTFTLENSKSTWM